MDDFSISDYLAIQALVHRYPRHLDSGDLVGVGQLFAQATVHFEGRPDPVSNDPAEVTRMFADFVRLYDGIPRTRHMICNLIVEPVSPDTARATSSVFVLQDAPGVPLQPIITGDYSDRFVKADGIWRFAERFITNDLFGNLTAHGKYALD
ncbi:MAG: nuclear transport factor 2 family protein [Novosphingobium sp.]|nr:nuclear transport factor 2 family protein [Novosphingobium sp.]